MAKTPAWQRAAGQSPSGGLNERGRASYHHETGGTLKAPTKDTHNSRHENFRARMCGMKEKLTSAKTAHDPNSRINLALKRWDVKC